MSPSNRPHGPAGAGAVPLKRRVAALRQALGASPQPLDQPEVEPRAPDSGSGDPEPSVAPHRNGGGSDPVAAQDVEPSPEVEHPTHAQSGVADEAVIGGADHAPKGPRKRDPSTGAEPDGQAGGPVTPQTRATRVDAGDEPRTLRDELSALLRRKWLILAFCVITPAAALVLSLSQSALYSASADVLLAQQDLPASLGGSQNAAEPQLATRIAQTNARLARLRSIAADVIAATNVRGLTPQDLLDESSVSSEPDTDLLTFTVRNTDSALATKLATEYARRFVAYRHRLDTAALTNARREIDQERRALGPSGSKRLRLRLRAKAEQLKTLQAVQGPSAHVVQTAGAAKKIRPRPLRNVVIGLALGLGLGIIAAFLAEMLDNRVRSEKEVAQRLGLPLLGRLPAPPRRRHGVTMLGDPYGPDSEAFRILRTGLSFANLERHARSIMVTSPAQEDGKSTTIANLAVAMARDGLRVALVDGDLRRPSIHSLFSLAQSPGLTDVALGHADLGDAITPVDLRTDADRTSASSSSDRGLHVGSLDVLSAGTLPPAPGEFFGTTAFGQILESMATEHDLQLVDASPAVGVGDALDLSAGVDAIVVVVRLDAVRRRLLDECRRVVGLSPAVALGFVVTGASPIAGYSHRYETASPEVASTRT